MQFIEPSAVLINEQDPCKKIELAGRTCYKSEDKISDDSAQKFTRGLIKSQHTAMVEHYVPVFSVMIDSFTDADMKASRYGDILRSLGPYFKATLVKTGVSENFGYRMLVSANIRALNESAIYITSPLLIALHKKFPHLVYNPKFSYYYNDGHYDDNMPIKAEIVNLDEIPNLSEREILAHKTMTIRFITDRGVTHELVRHRPCSFAQESTRYVNYQEGLQIVKPAGWDERPSEVQSLYMSAFKAAEDAYRKLIDAGQKPQQARAVLPNALKTEIVVTANMKEWNHIINLRMFGTTGAPHPDIKALMELAYPQFQADPVASRVLTTGKEKK